MRTTSVVVTVLLLHVSASAIAGESRTRSRPPLSDAERVLVLPVGDIADAVEPWTPEIRACWLGHASRRARVDGNLRVRVIVDPTGIVWQRAFEFAGGRNRHLERCLSRVVTQWRFPMRRGYTPAVVPYHFRASPGQRPFPSCWSPRGCARPQRQPLP